MEDSGASAPTGARDDLGGLRPIAVATDPVLARPGPRSRVDAAREAEALAHERGGRRDDAIRVLMTTYGSGVRAYARRIVGDDQLADDVRQQVFIEAWRGLDKFEGRASLWTWLCGIAYHRCLDAAKRRRRIGTGEVTLDADVLEALPGPPEGAMTSERLAQRKALERCLAQLPDAMRAQVLMRCYEGLSYHEIAAIVGDTAGTVQVRIARILPRLRRCLQARGANR